MNGLLGMVVRFRASFGELSSLMTHLRSSDVRQQQQQTKKNKQTKEDLKNRPISKKKTKTETHTSLNLIDFEASKNLKLGSISVRNALENKQILLTMI